MQKTTLEATGAILRADPTITTEERARLLAALKSKTGDRETAVSTDRLVRREEAAKLLACTPRTIDNLAKTGQLPRVFLPGRKQGAGFKLSHIQAIMDGNSGKAA